MQWWKVAAFTRLLYLHTVQFWGTIFDYLFFCYRHYILEGNVGLLEIFEKSCAQQHAVHGTSNVTKDYYHCTSIYISNREIKEPLNMEKLSPYTSACGTFSLLSYTCWSYYSHTFLCGYVKRVLAGLCFSLWGLQIAQSYIFALNDTAHVPVFSNSYSNSFWLQYMR